MAAASIATDRIDQVDGMVPESIRTQELLQCATACAEARHRRGGPIPLRLRKTGRDRQPRILVV